MQYKPRLQRRENTFMKTRKKSSTGEKNKNLRRILITKTSKMVNVKSTPEDQKKKKMSILKHEEKRKNGL
jgi:hypothetical protein